MVAPITTDPQVSQKIMKLFKLPTETKRKLIQGMQGQLTKGENERAKAFFYKHFADKGLEAHGVVNQAAYLLEKQKGECEAIDGNTSNPDYQKWLFNKLHKEARGDTSGARITV